MLTLSCWYWLSKGEGSYAVSITLQQNHSQLPAWMVGLWVKPVCRGEEIRLQLCRHWQSACLRTILLTVFLFVFCKSYTSCSCIKHFLAQLNLHIRHDFGIQNYVLFAIIIQLFALCIYIHIYTYIYIWYHIYTYIYIWYHIVVIVAARICHFNQSWTERRRPGGSIRRWEEGRVAVPTTDSSAGQGAQGPGRYPELAGTGGRWESRPSR